MSSKEKYFPALPALAADRRDFPEVSGQAVELNIATSVILLM
jgi:hypothetical protein